MLPKSSILFFSDRNPSSILLKCMYVCQANFLNLFFPSALEITQILMVQMILAAKQKQKQRCREQRGGRMNWDVGMDMYTLRILCIKQRTNENLLYSTGNPARCSVMTQMGRKAKNSGIHEYVWLIHFAVQQKLTQPAVHQFFKKKLKKKKTILTK